MKSIKVELFLSEGRYRAKYTPPLAGIGTIVGINSENDYGSALELLGEVPDFVAIHSQGTREGLEVFVNESFLGESEDQRKKNTPIILCQFVNACATYGIPLRITYGFKGS